MSNEWRRRFQLSQMGRSVVELAESGFECFKQTERLIERMARGQVLWKEDTERCGVLVGGCFGGWVKQRGGSSVLDGASEVVLHSYRSGLSAESAALLCGWVIWMSEKKMILRRERCGAMFVLCLQEYWEWMWNAKGGRGWPLRDGANGEVGVSEQGEELELWGGGKVSNRQFLKYLSWHRLSGLAMKGREMVWLTLCRLHG